MYNNASKINAGQSRVFLKIFWYLNLSQFIHFINLIGQSFVGLPLFGPLF